VPKIVLCWKEVFVSRRWFKLYVAGIALCLAFFNGVLLLRPAWGRCGQERWAVKTGTDQDAASVDMSEHPTTIQHLISISAPPAASLPSTKRVPDVETTVWVVTATLRNYKIEDNPQTGDSDYHLVLADDAGRTMIAEIPSPACVGSGSPFAGAIAHARSQFDARFAPVSGSFLPQDIAVKVQVTGVGFFDFKHGQRGLAPNGIELHPVLDIIFNPASPSPTIPGEDTTPPLGDTPVTPPAGPTPPAPTPPAPAQPSAGGELIRDGDFESTALHAWLASRGVINRSNSAPAHSGTAKAWLGGYGTTHVDQLSQKVSIPAGVNSAKLSFFLLVDTSEKASAGARDTLRVELRNPADGSVLKLLKTFSNRDAAAGDGNYAPHEFDVSQFAGQDVEVHFMSSEDSVLPTSFLIDDVSLIVAG
jgi:hypothetical protein